MTTDSSPITCPRADGPCAFVEHSKPFRREARQGDRMSPIPARYIAAKWRDMTPIDPEAREIGIGFIVGDREVFLRLSVTDVAHFADEFGVYRSDITASAETRSSAATGLDRSLHDAIALVEQTRDMSAPETAQYVFDRYRTRSPDAQGAIVLALCAALSTARVRLRGAA